MKQYQIINKSKIFACISIAILVIGLIFAVVKAIAFGPSKILNLSIDYTGGTIMTIDLGEKFKEKEVESLVKKVGINDAQVQTTTNADKEKTVAIIRFRQAKDKGLSNDQSQLRDKINAALKDEYPKASIKDGSVSSIGKTASGEMIENSIIAVLLACATILVYVSWRFDSGSQKAKSTRIINTLILIAALLVFYFFRSSILVISIATGLAIVLILFVSIRNRMYSGLASVVALFHDVAIMIAAMIIFNVPFSSSFMAAALTIIGYSINDTIIVFDRIRENENKSSRSTASSQIANRSLNEMLSRTIKTTVTTVLAALSIYILGVDAIKDFAFPMIIGLIAGSYSSVCIASPLWAFLNDRRNGRLAAGEKTA